jgi:hypothetical protein
MATPYREPDEPQPERFDIKPSTEVLMSLSGALLAVFVVVVSFLAGGPILMILLGVAAPAFVYLFDRGPRLIEVHHDRVVIRYWMRRARVIAGAELTVQKLPDELYFLHGDDIINLPAQLVANGAFEQLAESLRPMASSFVEGEAPSSSEP